MSGNSPFRFSEFNVKQLHDELRLRRLPVSGKKEVLIARLEEYEGMTRGETNTESESDSGVSNGTIPAKQGTAEGTGRLRRNSFADLVDIRRRELARQRNGVSIWNSPFTILKYLVLYISDSLVFGLQAMITHVLMVAAILAVALAGVVVYRTEGKHQETVAVLESNIIWYGWWLLLGIASSIGLGTGLHTFVLFLGPHIAHVTITAYQCHSLNFKTRGPDSFMCDVPQAGAATAAITVWQIARKVRWESFFWGLGTSVGELPPYFVARAAAEAGRDDQGFASIETLLAKPRPQRTFGERAQVAMYSLMQSLGFFGILLCASIPNPLFDLAGIVCGHFGVPFMTFFGATFLGKAVIKSSIQSFSVILMFSEDILAFILAELKEFAPSIHKLVQNILNEQVKRYQQGSHESADSHVKATDKTNYLGILWNTLLACMIGYFLLSLLESLAIVQMRRMHEREVQVLEADKVQGGRQNKGKGHVREDAQE